MIIFEYVEFNRSRMFHDNWATENLRWRANLHNLGSNGRCADIPTHQGHVALCLVEARDGTDEWRITKNVLLNMIDLIYIFFWYCNQFWNDHYQSKIMEEIFTHIQTKKWHVTSMRELTNTCSDSHRQASRAWVRLQPWAVSTLEIWAPDRTVASQWLFLNDTVHYGQSDVNQSDSFCSSQDQTMTSGGIHDKKGLRHSEYLRMHVLNNIPSIPLHTSSAVRAT